MKRLLVVFLWSLGILSLRAQPANVQADPDTGALFRPSAALFISGNSLTSTSVINGYFADPSTNASFNASAWRTDLSLVIGTNVQAYSANLTTFAGIAPSANVQALLSAADYAAIRTLLSLVAIATSGSASDLSSGTIPDARFPSTLPALSGANLTALNATQLTSGTVPDARFPSTLPALNGSALTALNATQLTSGTVPLARLSGITTSQLSATAGITNAQLANSAVTIAGTSTSLGASITLDTILGLSSTGIVARTTANTLAVRTLTGTAGQVTVSNGDGVSGNPTVALPSALTGINSITAAASTDLGLGANGAVGVTIKSTSQNVLIGGTTDISGTGGVKIFGNTASTNTTSGALQVVGGMGVQGAANIGGNVLVTASITASGGDNKIVAIDTNIGTGGGTYRIGSADGTSGQWVVDGTNTLFDYKGTLSIRSINNSYGSALILDASSGVEAPGLVHASNGTEATTGGLAALKTSGGIYAAKKIITGSTLTTAAGVAYDFGAANAVSPTAPNRTLTVVVAGTTYYIAAKTTND